MTDVVAYSDQDLASGHPRRSLRELSRDEFIQSLGSGTLKKSARLGINIDEAYLQERAQVEFGSGFELVKRSRVVYSDLMLEPCQAMTELGWHAERMIELRPFESDVFACKQFDVEYGDGKKRRAAGILVQATSAAWVPKGHMVLALVAERTVKGYEAARNPF